jgi:hypothetical protein
VCCQYGALSDTHECPNQSFHDNGDIRIGGCRNERRDPFGNADIDCSISFDMWILGVLRSRLQ